MVIPPLLAFLVLIALVLTILTKTNPPKIELWVPVFMICIILALMVWGK